MNKLEEIIRKYALKNAYSYGKADIKAVANKVFGRCKEARVNPRDVMPMVREIVDKVNKMDHDQIAKELEKYPDLMVKEEIKERTLPPLPNAEEGKVVTRMPPEPNAYPHIGHAISFFFNWYYARQYKGKVILRFDDTNPRKEKKEYYEAMESGLEWLGLDWDEKHYMSEDIPIMYKYAEDLIKKGKAYVCTCNGETIKKNRELGQGCEHREQSVEENLELWNKMLTELKEGEAVLRYKGDMKSKNTVMRDPTLARIINAEHPIQGDKYRVWPTYDFACSIEDSILGITHVLRSNEFELRNELQNAIRDDLGLRSPTIIHYSRFNVEGMKASKREIARLIEEGKVTGWDDPRLITLAGLKRRGILPETIKGLAMELGLSTSQPTISWENLFSINRKLLDPMANRYFLVIDPVRIIVNNAPNKTARLKLHPNCPERGFREVETSGIFFISRSDAETLKPGDKIRLKDLYNIEITSTDPLNAKYVGEEVIKGIPKIQWVTMDNVKTKLIIPDMLFKDGVFNEESLVERECLAEKGVANVKVDEIVQFERVGFARKDSDDRFILAHK